MATGGGSWLGGLRGVLRALRRQPRALAWVAPVAWMGLLWWASDQPARPDLGRGAALALAWNLAHAPAFATLALLLLPLAPRRWSRAGAGRGEQVWALLVAVAYGVVDEWHQSWVPGRQASALDVATDAAGALCALWIAGYVGREGAEEAGLRRRLLVGLALCLATAGAVTFLSSGR